MTTDCALHLFKQRVVMDVVMKKSTLMLSTHMTNKFALEPQWRGRIATTLEGPALDTMNYNLNPIRDFVLIPRPIARLTSTYSVPALIKIYFMHGCSLQYH